MDLKVLMWSTQVGRALVWGFVEKFGKLSLARNRTPSSPLESKLICRGMRSILWYCWLLVVVVQLQLAMICSAQFGSRAAGVFIKPSLGKAKPLPTLIRVGGPVLFFHT